MKKAVFLRIMLTAAVLALLLSGCRFVRVEERRAKTGRLHRCGTPGYPGGAFQAYGRKKGKGISAEL